MAALPVALALLLLLAAACSSGDSSSSSSSSEAPPEESSSSVIPGTVPRPDQTGGGKAINVALPAGGPIDNIIPPNTPAYRLLSSGGCDELLNTIDTDPDWGLGRLQGQGDPRDLYLYRGAARACKGNWDEARQDRDALAKLGTGYGSRCPRQPDDKEPCPACKAAVLRWLDSVLAARAKDPSFTPVFVTASGSSR
ncbi:MAG: hypothetical protein H0U41_04335, partial [Actinobacteria bacterium]|nr:hypothetical protein [Actinomycetota bacterium]